MTIQWIGNWSGEDVKTLAKDLRAFGVRARAEHSPYEGHKTLKIAANDLERAKTLLPELDSVHGEYIAQECLGG